MSDSLPRVRPEPGDGRYDIRLKRTLAQNCAKMADAGMFEHAMVALWEIGMERKVDGTPVENVDKRTRVQALQAFARGMRVVMPPDAPVPEGGPKEVHIHLPPGTPEKVAWLGEYKAALEEVQDVDLKPDGEA